MKTTERIAHHLRGVCFGGNSTGASLKEHLSDVTRQQATTEVGSLNTVLALTYHICYYFRAVLKVLQGGPLDAHDKYSFDHPPINSQEDWENFLAAVWSDAEALADLIEQLPDEKLGEDFVDAKYGSYYRNLHGIIEHAHYHLGQIVVVKKMMGEKS